MWSQLVERFNNKVFVHLPTGMYKYDCADTNKLLMSNTYKTSHDKRCIFHISALYHIDKSYLNEMDDWNPDSEISMFNKWDDDTKFPLKDKRDICEDFEALMTRYIYCESLLEKSNKKSYIFDFKTMIILVLLTILGITWYNIMYFGAQHQYQINVYNSESHDSFEINDVINTSDHEMLCLN